VVPRMGSSSELDRDPTEKSIAVLKGRTMGAYHAHFEVIAASILAPIQPEY